MKLAMSLRKSKRLPTAGGSQNSSPEIRARLNFKRRSLMTSLRWVTLILEAIIASAPTSVEGLVIVEM